MKQEDIDEEIRKFANNETHILVSTTIVEVGVNIPNATVMVIKNARGIKFSPAFFVLIIKLCLF